MMRNLVFLSLISLLVAACGSTTVSAPSNLHNTPFPRVQGRALSDKEVTIPDAYLGKPTLLLIGYVQKAQFDIDRWILGALQANIKAQIVEVPTIAGMAPRMVQSFIDSGMRSGIPESDWGTVVTVYEDASKIIKALGNERPNVARAVLLDKNGTIVWSSSSGYSATQILELQKVADSLQY
jgi:hypothetical protein